MLLWCGVANGKPLEKGGGGYGGGGGRVCVVTIS